MVARPRLVERRDDVDAIPGMNEGLRTTLGVDRHRAHSRLDERAQVSLVVVLDDDVGPHERLLSLEGDGAPEVHDALAVGDPNRSRLDVRLRDPALADVLVLDHGAGLHRLERHEDSDPWAARGLGLEALQVHPDEERPGRGDDDRDDRGPELHDCLLPRVGLAADVAWTAPEAGDTVSGGWRFDFVCPSS